MIYYVAKETGGKRECPYGVRDLEKDECYSGSGKNRCKYFVRYDWSDEHAGYVACTRNIRKLRALLGAKSRSSRSSK